MRPAQAERLAEILAEDRAERFDLAAAAAAALHADPAGGRAAPAGVTNHHILMDGWSMPVLVRELLTLYAQRRRCRRCCRG